MPLAGTPGLFLPGPGPLVPAHEFTVPASGGSGYQAGTSTDRLELCDNSTATFQGTPVVYTANSTDRLELRDEGVATYTQPITGLTVRTLIGVGV